MPATDLASVDAVEAFAQDDESRLKIALTSMAMAEVTMMLLKHRFCALLAG